MTALRGRPPKKGYDTTNLPKSPSQAHLVAFREAFDLTHTQCAALFGLTRVTWCRWERGTSPIPYHMIFALKGAVQHLKQDQGEIT